ncbi:alpha/beta fold hydrolase [Halobacillus salinus]|uniref:alpha/beta fold hydrolase n=1 Tax=Halobacillus salinus TaxID=192814 RepID=UPI0009A8BA86|nr:alpha/beta hydrolase [Halobacillus salinus]
MKTLVDIGDKNLEVWMNGTGRTVIIQPGMVSPLAEWEPFCEQLSRYARVIVYNRAGCGRSDKGTTPRNSQENVKDLKALIVKLDIHSPILVGHSYGGLILQQFAQEHPEVAGGFVLVDSTSNDAYKLDEVEVEGEDGGSTEAWIETCETYAGLTKEGLREELKDWIDEVQTSLPSSRHTEVEAFLSNPSMFEALREEIEYDLLCRGEDMPRSFPATPTIVIGRDPKTSISQMVEREGLRKSEAEEIENIWQALIHDQTKMNARTSYLLAERSGHSVHLEKPEVIERAIKSFLNSESHLHPKL